MKETSRWASLDVVGRGSQQRLGRRRHCFVIFASIFAVTGVQNGSAVLHLTVPGLVTPAFSALQGGGTASAEFEYPGKQATIDGKPAPTGGTPLGTGSSTITITSPIVNGSTQLQFSLFTDATAVCPNTFCMSEADFLDPTSITSASVDDANGQLVPDASLISQSGFNPNAVNTASTPEPSSIIMLCTGLAGFAATKAGKTRTLPGAVSTTYSVVLGQEQPMLSDRLLAYAGTEEAEHL